MAGITGSAHTCQSPLVACVGSRPFIVRQRLRLPRIPANFTRKFNTTPQRCATVLRAQQDGQEDQGKKPIEQEATKPPVIGGAPLEKGQGTAIVTGAISIIFGVLYLVLVQLLDTRGNQLEPPPPEAFEQGFLHVSGTIF